MELDLAQPDSRDQLQKDCDAIAHREDSGILILV
jgi:hypothetical protein